MAFTSGRFVICAHPDCDSVSLTTTRESFDEQDRIWVGAQVCDECGCSMLYSRRAETPLEVAMAKKATKKKFTTKTPKVPRAARRKAAGEAAAKAGHRINTHKSNGGMGASAEVAPASPTVGEAMRLAVKELGPVTIDPDSAVSELRKIAECVERIAEERAAYNTRLDAAKVAKKSLESAIALLEATARNCTHATPLPLFDAQQSEDDLENMVDAAEEAGHEGMHAE